LLFNHTILTHHITKGEDWEKMKTLSECSTMPSRDYTKPNNIVSFDRETSLSLSSISYPQDTYSHIQVRSSMEDVPTEISNKIYGAPETRFCPAHVYEFVNGKLQINYENCIHCKTCAVKTPKGYIKWNAPSSGGPNYSNM
jgi:electron-transferring-flavoprotein dehydrogenase